MLPIAQNAQTLKLAALTVQRFQRKFAADLPQLDRADVAGNACFFAGFQLDWQTVGIPARHIRSLVSAHILLADDEILEHLVERGAQMDIAVCIRRAVVQHKQRLALIVFNHLVVQIFFLPFLQPCWFTLRQRASHVELGDRQVQGFVVVLSHFVLSPLLIKMKI